MSMKMRSGIVVMLAAALLLAWTGSAFATNWIYIGHTRDGYSWYIDGETPQETDGAVVFWQLIVWDKPSPNGVKKAMIKLEATLSSPRQRQNLETYVYDSADREIARDLNPGKVSRVEPGSINDNCIDMALKYAKEK